MINKKDYNKYLDITGHVNSSKLKQLAIPENITWCSSKVEVLYCVMNNITQQPFCSCGGVIPFRNSGHGYNAACGRLCADKAKGTKISKSKLGASISKNKKIQKKKEATSMKRFGASHFMQSDVGHKIWTDAMIEKHGSPYALQNPSIADKQMRSCYSTKKYVYPSGNVISYQGYENQLLDELITQFTEHEILTNKVDMPEFWYTTTDNKKHRYYPDAFTPSTNTIYEVKSKYTLEQSKKKGVFGLKQQSVINAGYNFILRVYK